jgi:3-hydroxyisobutyrate dehydrogenase-like beta-hydroxyacid dehydrogenase
MNIAFIGLGQLGWPIAKRLLDKGHCLFVFDIAKAALQNAKNQGAFVATEPQEAAQSATLLFTCLPNEAIVSQTIQMILPHLQQGNVLVDLSTTTPMLARRMAALAQEYGVAFVDCPVSGGVIGAQQGTLCAMIGAQEAVYANIEPIIATFAQYRYRLGPPGSGQAGKLAHQFVFTALLALLREAKNFASGFDIAKEDFFTALRHCMAPNQVLDALLLFMKNPMPLDGLPILEKDITLVEESAHELGLHLTMLEATQKIFAAARQANPHENNLFSIPLEK